MGEWFGLGISEGSQQLPLSRCAGIMVFFCDSRRGSRWCHQEEKNKKKTHNQESAKRLISKARMKLRHSLKDIGVWFTSAVVLVSDDIRCIPLDVLQLGAGTELRPDGRLTKTEGPVLSQGPLDNFQCLKIVTQAFRFAIKCPAFLTSPRRSEHQTSKSRCACHVGICW